VSENGDNELFERMVARVLSYKPTKVRKKQKKRKAAKKKAKKVRI
jgi:hypothetical protein